MKTLKLFLAIFIAFYSLNSCESNNDEPIVNEPPKTEIPTGTLNLGTFITRDFIGQIVNESSIAIVGATVKIGSQTKTTDSNGYFIIKNASVATKMAYITASKTGFLEGSRSLVPTSGVNNVKIMLYASTPTQTINSGSASTVTLPNGTKVTFDGSFKTDNGTAYSGAVSVVVKHLDASDPKIDQKMPGMLFAQNSAGAAQTLKTFGMIDVVLLGTGGQKLQISNPSTIELPITTAQLATSPATIPLWHFDTVAGYWIEEGVATKIGNTYKGTVSHFSWWNCDQPLNFANLTINVVNGSNTPLANVRVDILPAGYAFPRQGYTNASGIVSGLVPANLTYDVLVYDNCGNLLLTLPQTALAVNSFTTLPNIVLSNSLVNTSLVSGTLLNCANTIVTNGYVYMNYGTQSAAVLVTNGTFSFSSQVCATQTTFTYQGYDYDNLQTTGAINSTFNFPNTNLGNIPTCTNISEYITYQIDNGVVNNILVNIKVTNPQGNILNISGGNPTAAGNGQFYLQGITSVGSYTTANGFQLQGNFLVGLNFINNAVTNDIEFNLNSFGPVGTYVDLVFANNYTDNANVIHTITGTVHALRDN